MEKIKGFLVSDKGKDIMVVLIIILVGLSSFGLGRLSVGGGSSGIKIEYPDGEIGTLNAQTATALNGSTPTEPFPKSKDMSYFASNRGQKYYSQGCAAGKNIKVENRVYFSTKEEAEKAGYELSSSCR